MAALGAADEPTGRVSIQVQSPPPDASLRVFFDERELPLAPVPPRPDSPADQGPPPQTIGEFDLARGSRHQLRVEAPATGQRAQLFFTVDKPSQWILIHYYAGRAGPWAPPMLTFSLNDAPYAAK